ncbi:hypothetical protein [Bradyrhizobium sp. CCGUVB23]|uniref:hypothetical protein n=1 Tax=Bradyrhizobium sp. CCGUVB23 TaxID=2949630 RepID=UPI0020B17E0B|nr:hypothetical protein [Bradyrhizobium sp. CCGUVB23]MCP3460374.1 hypothetical protein [Bradyrhizobium sp. CCGUVB23]
MPRRQSKNALYYVVRGLLHRIDGPAAIECLDGITKSHREYWRLNGWSHRDPREGSSYKVVNENGPIHESYAFKGFPYRNPSEGPRRIWYFCNNETFRHFTPKAKYIGPNPSVSELSRLFKKRIGGKQFTFD